MELNKIYNTDCIQFMNRGGIEDGSISLTITDIPYDAINRKSNGLKKLCADVGLADKLTFDIDLFLNELYRITSSTIIIFCGKEQMSNIYKFFANKQNNGLGTVRQIIWEKTNPVPSNGKYVYLSGIENAVWFRKRNGTFNAFCKNTVFRYPITKNRIHPTEKNHELLKELILDNSNEGDIIFDPCAGSGSHLLVAKQLNRNYIGCELDKNFYEIAKKRLYEFD